MNKSALFRLEPGEVLDKKYRIDDIIGSGGMGFVYRATNIILKREVAIKTLQSHRNSDDTALRRFHQEAQIAASIGHDNICEVIDFGSHSPAGGNFDIYYLIMPLLPGQSLGQWFDSWVKPSPSLFIDIIAQTLLGLHAAHQKKIVHRDLKPDNIFVTHIGDRDNFVKILDFGISKYLESDAAISLTKTGIAMGTPLYMSPEQARGSRDIDHTTDIYSVGAVLYEGFVGKHPYYGENFGDLLLQIATKPFPAPRRVNPTVPKEIEAVILKSMARNPADRYGTAIQMRQALLRAAAMANIDDRKSFVYPSPSAPPIPMASEHNTVALKSNPPGSASISESRRIEAKLREVTGSLKQPPKDSIPPQSGGSLKWLVGIIVISLLAAAIGVGTILVNRTSAEETGANIIPVTPMPENSPDGSKLKPAGSSPASVPSLPPAQVELKVPLPADSIRRPEGENTNVVNEEIRTRSTHPVRKKEAVESTGVSNSKPAPKAKEEEAPPADESSGQARSRIIERDVDSIFD